MVKISNRILLLLGIGLLFIAIGAVPAFAAQPTMTAATTTTSDTNNDGTVDRITITFSEAVVIIDANADDGLGSLALSSGCTIPNLAYGIAAPGATTLQISNLTGCTAGNTGITPTVTYTAVANCTTAGAVCDNATTTQMANAHQITSTDAAAPVLTAVALSASSNKNRISFTYTEAITATNGASTTAKGDLTAVGTFAGFGDFATNGTVTVPTTKNTVGGSGTTTITIDLADQTAGYMDSTSVSEPSGNVTPLASASVVDAVNLQVNTSAAVVAATGGGTWDLAKPTIASVTVADATGNDGKIDQATIVFSGTTNAIKDTSITNGDATLGTSGTTTGTFATGTANDNTTVFTRTNDNAVDTSTAAGSFLYSGTTTKITDLAGNLLDTATDGTIIAADIVETDGAKPILVSATKGTSSNQNTLVLVYSEAMYIDNSNQDGTIDAGDTTGGESLTSTASVGGISAAGTVRNIGTFGTTGTVTQSAETCNTAAVAANGLTITVTFNTVAHCYYTNSVTTASAAFTPTDGLYVLAQAPAATTATQRYNTSATAPTSTGTWDLTAPSAVSNLMVQGSSTSNVYLVWGPLATLADFSRYVVYRQQAVSSTTFTNGTAWTYANDANLSLIATGTTNITGLNTGYHYYFVAYAADIAGNMSTVSNEVSIATSSSTTTDATAPSAPTSFAGSVNSEGKVVLTWVDPTATDLKNIQILRGKNNIPISGLAYATVLKGVKTYTDSDVVAGDVLKYQLRASDTNNNFSSLTSIVSVTVPVPSAETPVQEESGQQDVTPPPSTEEEQPSVTPPPAEEESSISPAVQAKIERMERLISKYQARYDAYQAKYLKFEDKNAVKYRKYITRYKKRAEKYGKLVEKYTERLEALQGE